MTFDEVDEWGGVISNCEDIWHNWDQKIMVSTFNPKKEEDETCDWVPTRKMIESRITEYQNYDPVRMMYELKYVYEDNETQCATVRQYRADEVLESITFEKNVRPQCKMMNYEVITIGRESAFDEIVDKVRRYYHAKHNKNEVLPSIYEIKDALKELTEQLRIDNPNDNPNTPAMINGECYETETIATSGKPFGVWELKNKKEEETNMPYEMIQKFAIGKENTRPAYEFRVCIKSIQFYNNRVTKVEFEDGTFTKAVCGPNDIFNEDVGITICIMKKMMGGQKDGTRNYSKILNYAHEVMADQEKEKEEKKKAEEERRKKIRKADIVKMGKKMKAKEDAIDIQTQAILRAHRILEKEKREEGLL